MPHLTNFEKLLIKYKRENDIKFENMTAQIRNLEIRTNNLEIRMSESPFLFIKRRMVNAALEILYHNNNIDNILSSKNDLIRLGKFSITKNEFKVRYSKMCNGRTFVSPSDKPIDRFVNDMIRTVRNEDFSTVDPRSVIIFAKEIIENYENIKKIPHIL